MNILIIALVIFLVLETSNVIMLYFTPETTKGNGLGVFNAYEKSKDDPEVHALVKYLINWVAGTKLIFIALLVVLIIIGDGKTLWFATVALVLSILSFYWRLYPIIKGVDSANQVSPKGYSKTLAIMIAGFVLVLTTAIIFSYFKIF